MYLRLLSTQSWVAWPATGFCKGEGVWSRLAGTGLSRKFVYESFEAILQQFLVEIDQKSYSLVGYLQITDKLCFMHGKNLFYRLKLKHDTVLHKNVDSKVLAEKLASVLNWD